MEQLNFLNLLFDELPFYCKVEIGETSYSPEFDFDKIVLV